MRRCKGRDEEECIIILLLFFILHVRKKRINDDDEENQLNVFTGINVMRVKWRFNVGKLFLIAFS